MWRFSIYSVHNLMTDEARMAAATLDAISGPLKGSSFNLREGITSLGRDPSNSISILDGSVSRHQCTIEYDGEQFVLKDLDSRNSTFVNGVPIKERALKLGDEVRVGSSLFLFVP